MEVVVVEATKTITKEGQNSYVHEFDGAPQKSFFEVSLYVETS
jgi:hypothetical protein